MVAGYRVSKGVAIRTKAALARKPAEGPKRREAIHLVASQPPWPATVSLRPEAKPAPPSQEKSS